MISHVWNFGDGGSSGLVSPAHQYTTAGNYNINALQ
ncbi:MAG: PKD domain-containing protein [Chitinophagaceae bacterium]|nr:PKD domain-containing protein [Chitinophagaceae bacterium]